jgi:hypothetical protein
MSLSHPAQPPRREARIRYLDADYEILQQGDFVRCAVTGQAVALPDLRYWDVAAQQPFASAEAAFGRRLTTGFAGPA